MDDKILEKELTVEVENAASLDELEARLRSQPYVKSVELTDYLLKSYPPQREFIVEFDMPDGSTDTRVVNIFDLGDGQFQFNGIRSE